MEKGNLKITKEKEAKEEGRRWTREKNNMKEADGVEQVRIRSRKESKVLRKNVEEKEKLKEPTSGVGDNKTDMNK